MDPLLDPASALVECVTSEPDDVEGIHHCRRGRELFGGRGLEAREAVHRDDLNMAAPGLVLAGR